MSNISPPVEQQRFARTQTPESPRPVHVPEPANIPVLLNQMDPSSNDLATYNIPLDQNFAHYGDTLENPAYKTASTKEDPDPFHAFLRNADNVVANELQIHSVPHASVPENPDHNVSAPYTNHAALSLSHSQLASNPPSTRPVPLHYADVAPTETTYTPPPVQDQPLPGAVRGTDETMGNIQEPPVVGHGQPLTGQDDALQPAQPSGQGIATASFQAQTAVTSDPGASLGVDYQSLLDTITQSASAVPAVDAVPPSAANTNVSDPYPNSLPSFPGLPPKPPPLETKTVFPASASASASASATASSESAPPLQQSHNPVVEALYAQQNAANGFHYQTDHQVETAHLHSLPVNPFEGGMTNEQAISMHMQQNQQDPPIRSSSPLDRAATEPADRPWSPKTQAIYDRFLEDERRYVTEGIWDRFPSGSRLFVGNLPSEKVTKRDLFHKFHPHGKLAQISIKQAYGFIQFHESSSCKAALDAEQGVELRGRKVHLEISKPQKGSKSAVPSHQPLPTGNNSNSNSKNQPRRRSRSPQRRQYSDYRDESSRRREDFRSRRSPSPRNYRRDDRAGSRDDRRSPMHGNSYGAPSPVIYDDEANLPYPRRDPRYVPDVQVIVLDSVVDQAFLNWVEDGLKRKGLSVGSTWLTQRTPLPAVIKRQIMEGVQAVVKITSVNQMRSKVPVQVFDRSTGTSNVTFNEYADLDVPIAADIIIQARQKERSTMYAPRPPFPPSVIPPNPYQQQPPHTAWMPQSGGVPQQPPQPHLPPPIPNYQYPPQPPQPLQPPQHPQHVQHIPQQYRPPQSTYPQSSSATSQPANLHELLANLKGGTGTPSTPQSVQSLSQSYMPYGQPLPPLPPPQPQQQQQQPQQHQQQPQPQQYYGQPPYQQVTHVPTHAHQQQNGVGSQQNVQNIMDQLARFQRG